MDRPDIMVSFWRISVTQGNIWYHEFVSRSLVFGFLIGADVAEFAKATAGVGVLMARSSFALDMASSLAALRNMTLIGLLLLCAMERLDDRIVFWRRDARMSALSRAPRLGFGPMEGGKHEPRPKFRKE